MMTRWELQAYGYSVSIGPCTSAEVDWVTVIHGLRTALQLRAVNVTLFVENLSMLHVVSFS